MALHTRVAARTATPKLRALLGVAEQYPGSYDRVRVMTEADAILDEHLDRATWLIEKVESATAKLNEATCAVCKGVTADGEFCEFCPKG